MYQNYNDISYAESPFGTLNQYMTKTFGWMFAGLLVTFAVAIGAISTGLVYAFINSGVFFITCIAELILVGVLSARVTSLQPGTATGIFFAYAALNGLNLCSIFLIYDLGSLVLAFLVGAVYFGVMAVYGATTNRSLVGWGPKLMGGLIAMIICSLVGSLFSLFGFSFGFGDLLLCAVGLFLFMGLTAYDTQMLKHHYAYFGGDAAMLHKASIIGALNLYLDFINIFLYVVRLLGRRLIDGESTRGSFRTRESGHRLQAAPKPPRRSSLLSGARERHTRLVVRNGSAPLPAVKECRAFFVRNTGGTAEF